MLFDQAQTASEKQEHYGALRELYQSTPEVCLDTEQYDYFSTWYMPVVRELVCLLDFGDDWERLGKACSPVISARQAQEAVELLIRLQLIEKSGAGYRQKDSALTTGSDIVSNAVRAFNGAMIELGRQAIERFDREQRHVSGLTMAASPATSRMIAVEIERFKERLTAIANRDRSPTRVYQFNVQLFPLSSEITEHVPDDPGGSE